MLTRYPTAADFPPDEDLVLPPAALVPAIPEDLAGVRQLLDWSVPVYWPDGAPPGLVLDDTEGLWFQNGNLRAQSAHSFQLLGSAVSGGQQRTGPVAEFPSPVPLLGFLARAAAGVGWQELPDVEEDDESPGSRWDPSLAVWAVNDRRAANESLGRMERKEARALVEANAADALLVAREIYKYLSDWWPTESDGEGEPEPTTNRRGASWR